MTVSRVAKPGLLPAVVGTLIVTISLFLTWFGPPRDVARQSPAHDLQEGAFASGVSVWLALVALAVCMTVLVFGPRDVEETAMSRWLWPATLLVAIVAVILIGFRLINLPQAQYQSTSGATFTHELPRSAGVYLATSGFSVVLVGAAIAARAAGATLRSDSTGPEPGATLRWAATAIRSAWVALIPASLGLWLLVLTFGAENHVCIWECEPAPVQAVGFTLSAILLLTSFLLVRRRWRRHRRTPDRSSDSTSEGQAGGITQSDERTRRQPPTR